MYDISNASLEAFDVWPFNIVDTASETWTGSSNANGFNPGDIALSGSIKL